MAGATITGSPNACVRSLRRADMTGQDSERDAVQAGMTGKRKPFVQNLLPGGRCHICYVPICLLVAANQSLLNAVLRNAHHHKRVRT